MELLHFRCNHLDSFAACTAKNVNEYGRLSDAKKAGCVAERVRYVQRGEEDAATRPVTVWVSGLRRKITLGSID